VRQEMFSTFPANEYSRGCIYRSLALSPFRMERFLQPL
jgi:hypothetical protein